MDAPFRWIFSGMFALIPGIFFAIGLSEALEQVNKYSHATTTQGVIVAPDEGVVYAPGVTPPAPRPFNEIDPRVRFRYTAEGKERFAEQDIFFLQTSGKLPRFALNDAVTVHYNAQRPGTAWLHADIDAMPFMLMLFVTPFWTIAVGVFFLTSSAKAARPATPVGDGWHQLPVLSTRADKLLNAWILLVAASIPGTAIYLHTRIAPPWASFEMGIATTLYLLFLFAMIGHVFYRVSALRAGREAVVLINAPAATIGQPLMVRVEHDLRRAIPTATLEVGLHCRRDEKTSGGGKTQYSTDNVHDSWQLSRDVSGLSMGQPAVCDGELEFPPDARPSNPEGDRSYPRHTWTVQVRTHLPGADYNAKFPLQVLAGSMPRPRMMPRVETTGPAISADEAHDLGLEHDTHRIVADAQDDYHAADAYDVDADHDHNPDTNPDDNPYTNPNADPNANPDDTPHAR